MKEFILRKSSKLLLPCLSALAALLMILAFHYSSHTLPATYTISQADITTGGQTKRQTLPIVLNRLSPGTKVEVSFSVPKTYGDDLFFGSVYAPVTILSEDTVLYQYGAPSDRPGFMQDPPTIYTSVKLPDTNQPAVTVKIIYYSPNERDTLSIHAPVVGNEQSIFHMLITESGIPMILALFFISIGAVMSIVSLFFFSFPFLRKSLLYLGMLCICSGAWQFGENRFAVYLSGNAVLMYMLDFCGLFFMMIPLYKMAILFLDIDDNMVIHAVLLALILSAAFSLILELTGVAGFHRSLYLFHVLLPAALLFLVGISLYYFLRYHKKNAGLFTIPFLILFLAAVIELANYYFQIFEQFSFFFQMGILLFLITMTIYTGLSVRRRVSEYLDALTIQNDIEIQRQTIEMQKNRNELLLSHYDEIRKQRHDLRHHLRMISELLHEGKSEETFAYIRSITDSIPVYHPEVYCDNTVVNTMICYYIGQLRNKDVDIRVNLHIPANNPDISDPSLCILFGNLMENAVEACEQMKGKRFVRLSSMINDEMLYITMDNSYPSGSIQMEDNLFISTKDKKRGLGLRSIQDIAAQHDGYAEFHAENGVFKSELCVRL